MNADGEQWKEFVESLTMTAEEQEAKKTKEGIANLKHLFGG